MTTAQLPPAGAYIRRASDGMLGRVLRRYRDQRTAYSQPDCADVEWIDEWTQGILVAGSRSSAPIVILADDEAAAAAAAFASILCPICGGSGLRPGARYNSDTCEAGCQLGRVLGVRPGFDASYAAYQNWHHRINGWSRAPLRYPGSCAVCQAQIAAGTEAWICKIEGRWEIRCTAHPAT